MITLLSGKRVFQCTKPHYEGWEAATESETSHITFKYNCRLKLVTKEGRKQVRQLKPGGRKSLQLLDHWLFSCPKTMWQHCSSKEVVLFLIYRHGIVFWRVGDVHILLFYSKDLYSCIYCVGLPGLAGGPDLGFGFPWNGGIPAPIM